MASFITSQGEKVLHLSHRDSRIYIKVLAAETSYSGEANLGLAKAHQKDFLVSFRFEHGREGKGRGSDILGERSKKPP